MHVHHMMNAPMQCSDPADLASMLSMHSLSRRCCFAASHAMPAESPKLEMLCSELRGPWPCPLARGPGACARARVFLSSALIHE